MKLDRTAKLAPLGTTFALALPAATSVDAGNDGQVAGSDIADTVGLPLG